MPLANFNENKKRKEHRWRLFITDEISQMKSVSDLEICTKCKQYREKQTHIIQN